MRAIAGDVGVEKMSATRYADARRIFTSLVLAPELAEFLTTIAYASLDA